MKIVQQHNIIGELISEIIDDSGIITVIDTGNGLVALRGKAYLAKIDDILGLLEFDLQNLVAKYTTLGVSGELILETLEELTTNP